MARRYPFKPFPDIISSQAGLVTDVRLNSSLELMSEICGHAVDVISARNIKFISPVIPADDTRLIYQFGDSGSVSVLMDGKVCASMALKLQ